MWPALNGLLWLWQKKSCKNVHLKSLLYDYYISQHAINGPFRRLKRFHQSTVKYANNHLADLFVPKRLICLFACLHLSIYLSICLSVYLSICLSVYLSVCLSVCPHTSNYVEHIYIYTVYICVYICVCIHVYMCVCSTHTHTHTHTYIYIICVYMRLYILKVM